MIKKTLLLTAALAAVSGCVNEEPRYFDALVTQFNSMGRVTNCWRLEDTRMKLDDANNLAFWDKSTIYIINNSNLNVAYIFSDNEKSWLNAAAMLGIDLEKCQNGTYPAS